MWFLSAIPLIGKLFDFGSNVTNAIRDLQLRKVDAQSEKEKAEIQERIDQLQAQAGLQSDEAKAGIKLNAFARFLFFGFPAGAVIWKYIVFDKVLGSFVGCAAPVANVYLDSCKIFRTDGLDTNMWWVVFAVASFYLVTSKK